MVESSKNFRGLYAVVDDNAHYAYGVQKLIEQIVLDSTIPVLQLRLKESSLAQKKNYVQMASALKKHRTYLLIINDDSLFLEYEDVDGIHLGQHDGDFAAIRKRFPQKILGRSTHSLEEAQIAQSEGADYIGCGALFPTTTKSQTVPLAIEDLQRICQAVKIPKVAIGGIHSENMTLPMHCGCDMVAMISGLIQNNKFVGQNWHEILCHNQ